MIPFGTPRRHVAQCGSTNDLARDWAHDSDDPAPSGALVTADFQTRGRGQRGRQWQAAAAESALMSFVYRVPSAADVSQLGLVVALAVADAVATVAGLEPRIKWPNDILLDGRKGAGILVEVVPPPQVWGAGVPIPAHKFATLPSEGRELGIGQGPSSLTLPSEGRDRPGTNVNGPGLGTPAPQTWGFIGVGGGAILGIGINVNQERFDGAEEFAYPPTSLRLASGQNLEVEAVIAAVGRSLAAWEDRWCQEGFLPIVQECRARLAVGATVRQGENHAELVGLDPSGAAQVRLQDGTFALWRTVD